MWVVKEFTQGRAKEREVLNIPPGSSRRESKGETVCQEAGWGTIVKGAVKSHGNIWNFPFV